MSDLKTLRLSDCWAKTWQEGPLNGQPGLSVRDHCLHVGAVAEALYPLLPAAAQRLLPSSAVTLTAMHDIGKLTAGFLQQCPDWKRQWLGQNADASRAAGSEKRHAAVSQFDLDKRLGILGKKSVKRWAAALGGHHGQFMDHFYPKEFLEEKFQSLRDELAGILLDAFGPLAVNGLPSSGPERTAPLMLLTGFMITCDWIGSNTEWFPLTGGMPETPVEEATAQARRMAANALASLGWNSLPWREDRAFHALFDIRHPPSDLQTKARRHIVSPGLYIVEAPMGTGKTEAALWAGFHLIHSGAAGGLYFALPTQLTSNSIHTRVGDFAARAGTGESVRVPLIHSASWLKSPESLIFSDAGHENGDEHWRAARSWFTSRRALLSPLGAGTIDQALMGTLPVKYAALRLFGLAGKVVILDEVHSYDVYTGTVLDCLIRLLRRLGCTVIVLSATLTQRRRRELLDLPEGTETPGDGAAYPLLTCAPDSGPVSTVAVERDPRMRRAVELEHIILSIPELDPDLLERLADLAAQGACILVVRNTVALAQSTWAAFKSTVKENVEVGLIHSRFPHFLRHGDDAAGLQGRESQWVARLGKAQDDRPHNRPHGCILVGTQVLEQSLDIDADFLVTDLCPVDLLLQRLGRLHRHEASQDHPRPACCQEPRAVVLNPQLPADDEPDPKAWKSALRPHGSIYAPIILLRTQAVLRAVKNPIRLPDSIRELIEEVYESARPDEPPAWTLLEAEVLEKKRENRSLARAFAMEPAATTPGSDDEHTAATRLINCPTVPLVLLAEAPAAQPGGTIRLRFLHGREQVWNPHEPWEHGLARAIFLNAVPVPLWWLKNLAFTPPAWLAGYVHGGACAAVVEDSGVLKFQDGSAEAVLTFSPEAGVQMKPKPSSEGKQEWVEPESWF